LSDLFLQVARDALSSPFFSANDLRGAIIRDYFRQYPFRIDPSSEIFRPPIFFFFGESKLISLSERDSLSTFIYESERCFVSQKVTPGLQGTLNRERNLTFSSVESVVSQTRG